MNRRLSRIRKFEKLMKEAEALLDTENKTPESTAALKEKAAALEGYYTGKLWKKDFEADEKGLIPKDVERGVLSEDGLYDLLSRCLDRLDEKEKT